MKETIRATNDGRKVTVYGPDEEGDFFAYDAHRDGISCGPWASSIDEVVNKWVERNPVALSVAEIEI